MNSESTLYIIDGSSYIFRAYYAVRHLSTSKGLPTNATYGFTQMLLRLMKDHDPKHLVMVFDTAEPSFRKKDYPPYKANREVPPEDLLPQFDYIRKVVQAMNIPMLESPGFEADDIIATLVRKVLPEGQKALIVTGDKDLMQLVDDRVVLLDTMREKLTDIKGVHDKFGVTPEQVIDVLALAGDSSDNVPGVPGIGPKTASQLIQDYQSLKKLYDHLDKIKGKKKENLEKYRDQAFLSKHLVTLHDDVPLKIKFSDLKRQSPIKHACQKLFTELEFHRLLEEFGDAPKTLPTKNYYLVQDKKTWVGLLKKLKISSGFAMDTETTSLDVREAKLVGLSFALAPGEAYYVPVGHKTEEAQLDLKSVLTDLKPLLADASIPKYFQNYKYDAGVLQNYDLFIEGLKQDTMLASYLLDPAESHKLDALSLKYLQHKMVSYEEVTKKKSGGDFALVPLNEATQYSAEDADVTFQLTEIFQKKLKKDKLVSLLEDLEQLLTKVLLKMEGWGVKVDVKFLEELNQDFTKRIKKHEKKIYQLAGSEFNIQSPKQLSEILFNQLKLPGIKKTKTGYSTNVEVLEELAKLHPLPQVILDFRSLSKLKSTYVEALLKLKDPKTHRVHTDYNQTVAETGRLSSRDPNLQNIPIRTEEGAKIRQAFVAAPGFILCSADYSQIELRVLAHFSQDPVLLQAFQEEEDVHRKTAASIFGVTEEKVNGEQRAVGKTVNFAVIYGQSPFGLSKQLGITQKEAREYIESYFSKYQGVKNYRKKVLAQARESGEVRTLLGRRRFVSEINSKNTLARNLAERVAFNTVLQGTAADLIKKAMIDLDQKISQQKLASRLLMQVHDELILEVKKEERAKVLPIVKNCMEEVMKFEVPLTVEIGEGKTWAEAHP